MHKIYFLLMVIIVLTIPTNPLMSQKKQSECEIRVKELEERIKYLETMNLKLLDKINEPIQTKQEGEFVIVLSKYLEAKKDKSIGEFSDNTTPNYELLSATKSKFDPYLESIKSDLKLTYLHIKNDKGHYDAIYYHGELGFFNTQQQAYEAIGKYLSKGFEDCNISVKSVHDKE